ncbi:hypothetical protein GW17_00019693 [Ensete ventricosum]|nr:hypothetical protein GW17_00019693 [Ensete ventricosum]
MTFMHPTVGNQHLGTSRSSHARCWKCSEACVCDWFLNHSIWYVYQVARLSLDNCVSVDTNGGAHYDIYDEDGGCFVIDPLGRLLDPKLGSPELLWLPPLSHQFRHEHEEGENGGGGSLKEFYSSQLSLIETGSSGRLAGEQLSNSQRTYPTVVEKCGSWNLTPSTSSYSSLIQLLSGPHLSLPLFSSTPITRIPQRRRRLPPPMSSVTTN